VVNAIDADQYANHQRESDRRHTNEAMTGRGRSTRHDSSSNTQYVPTANDRGNFQQRNTSTTSLLTRATRNSSGTERITKGFVLVVTHERLHRSRQAPMTRLRTSTSDASRCTDEDSNNQGG